MNKVLLIIYRWSLVCLATQILFLTRAEGTLKKGLVKWSVPIDEHYAMKILACEPRPFNTSFVVHLKEPIKASVFNGSYRSVYFHGSLQE